MPREKMITVTAKFTGTSVSLGYVPNQVYELVIIHPNKIMRNDGSGICEYSGLVAFMENWTNVKQSE